MHYLLVHSPLVGPATWIPVADELRASEIPATVPSLTGVASAPRPGWRHAVRLTVASVENIEAPIVLVGHSGAGAFLPSIGEELDGKVACYLFVDAQLPARSGELATGEAFLEFLRSLSKQGRLPPWSRWWGEEAMSALIPDPQARQRFESELPEVPLSYFEDPISIPEGWDRVPVGYLHFSEAYQPAAREAATRGFLVEHLPGGHLHAVVEPAQVARLIAEMAEKLR